MDRFARARFRFASSFRTAECGVDITARNIWSMRSAPSGLSHLAASSGEMLIGFG
jgi:hypothetical protein